MNEVVITSDDSPSVYSSQFDALYHSKHGAIQESEHVFINSGLDHFVNSSDYNERGIQTVKILEIGFGTGLNAVLTDDYALKKGISIEYTGLEGYPLSPDTLKEFDNNLGLKESHFQLIHKIPWGTNSAISDFMMLKKVQVLFEQFQTDETFDIIYFDAFAPNTQPDLWEIDMMKKMYEASHIGSILVTYCAKGQVRRNMQSVGFDVERIPGPPGKRQMLRAIRKI